MLSHAGFTGNFQCELRNMRTQAFGLVQSASMCHTSEIG